MKLTPEQIAQCVKLTEEYGIYKKHQSKSVNYEKYWNSERGIQHKEKLKKAAANNKNENTHCKKYKIILTNIDTNEKYTVYGNKELANFLGYKSHNSSLDRTVVKDITGNNTYKVEKYK